MGVVCSFVQYPPSQCSVSISDGLFAPEHHILRTSKSGEADHFIQCLAYMYKHP